MNPFVDIEDELKRAEATAMPEDMRDRVLQGIRSERAMSRKSGHNNRNKWVPWVSIAAGLVIAGTVGTLTVQHAPGTRGKPSPTMTANQPAPTSLATTVPVVGKHVKTSNLDVVYPQVEGLPNLAVQKTINQTLKMASIPNNQLETTGQNAFESSYVITYQKGNLV
jgi:hypothetical protein